MFDPDFDGQKLMFHPDRVAQWLAEGKTSGPLYTELEISNRCNCRCLFCGVDHLVNGTGTIMAPDLAALVFDGLAELGNRSVMICGNGEPLLNPDVVEIVRMAAARMSVSMTTNGVALSPEKLSLIDELEWIRFSINGCDPENYALVHGTGKEVFTRVLANVESAVARKKRLNLAVTIGTQLVLLPENESGAVELARRLKAIGVDYFSIKPYSQHPLSRNRRQIDYRGLLDLEERLRPLEEDGFSIIFRAAAMQRAGTAKSYRSCRGIHFISFITADGAVWECNVFAGDDRFAVGKVGEQTLPEIWCGPVRQRVVDFIEHDFDLGQCRDLCRMEACNRYLWRLENPRPHDNFI
ncbi:MAG: radical SAM protein [Proteobacteria bacterium]|nr:radical SAM protein [Pseudomonadota bacterium]MBU1687333.1 radical SAM protein [Pseudomonadota bacterium]